jgi:phage gp45-like
MEAQSAIFVNFTILLGAALVGGNMTTRGTQTITWDVENRVTAVTGGASFVYDGDGNRVKKTENGETILYVNKYYEKNITTGIATTSYYLGDRLIAQVVEDNIG